MDRIEKELRKLTSKEREQIADLLRKLAAGKTANLNIKKLKGYNDIFRIRKGGLRIIYRKDAKVKIFVLAIERRREDTYKF